MKRRSRQDRAPAADTNRVYELEVFLLTGQVTEAFVEKNPVISRTIEIRGDQTLEQLHETIFEAYDRWEEHVYEFQVGGRGPMDPKARRYVLSMDCELYDRKPAGIVAETTIDALGLKTEEAFGYWFDFGDDWWHQVDVVAIRDAAAGGKYPKVTAKTGDSPPQYPDLDDEEDE